MDELNFSHDELAEPSDPASSDGWDEPLLAEDLEAAYLRALEATDTIEREIDSESSHTTDQKFVADEPSTSEQNPPCTHSPSESLGTPPTDSQVPETATAEVSETTRSNRDQTRSETSTAPRVTEKQVVEAALFVGGMPLTAKKLSSLFHTDHGFGFVECLIDELNQQYAEEGRPYSITLGEGGYRLALLPEFEPVRNKVFGYGPKDVKLTQDALEVLSLVAYKQPISKSQIEALGKANPGTSLRQLLQRELIRIDREHAPKNAKSKNDPPYVTTPRFLSLFGIGNIHDLPVAEDFDFK